MSELRECPGCGRMNLSLSWQADRGPQIKCRDCGLAGPSVPTDIHSDHLAAASAPWNDLPRRSDIDTVTRQRDAAAAVAVFSNQDWTEWRAGESDAVENVRARLPNIEPDNAARLAALVFAERGDS